MMIVALIFYFHMKVNGHEILVSTNAAKLPKILSGWFRGICFTSRFLGMATTYPLDPSSKILVHLYLFLESLLFTILKKRLAIYQGVPLNVPKYF